MDRATVASNIANWSPTHLRGPAPKGKNAKPGPPGPPTPKMRVKAALAKVHDFLGRADTQAAREELVKLYELKEKEPELEAAPNANDRVVIATAVSGELAATKAR